MDASMHLPKWVLLALDDLDRCMIGKQRSAAVGHIQKIRTYLSCFPPSSSSSSFSSSAEAAHKDLSHLVTQHADAVAFRVTQDLESMTPSTACSILSDFSDVTRQLKLLVLLGKSGTAVDFFIRNRGGMLARCLRQFEAGGDTLLSITLLAETFFGLITEACMAFEALFAATSTTATASVAATATSTAATTAATGGGGDAAEGGQDVGEKGGKEGGKEVMMTWPPDCVARIVLWVEREVKYFSELVGRQLGMMRRDVLVGQRSSGGGGVVCGW